MQRKNFDTPFEHSLGSQPLNLGKAPNVADAMQRSTTNTFNV